MELLRWLFDPASYLPHGHCYLWRPALLGLHAVSDSLIGVAYTSIPFTLAYFVRRRRDLPYNWMFFMFALFIIACGATHYMEVWTIWFPSYWLSGAIKAVTAVASLTTAVLLIRLVPAGLALPSRSALEQANRELSAEVERRQQAERERRRSEERFRLLVDQIKDYAIFMIEPDGRVASWNLGAQLLEGYEPEEILGHHFRCFYPGDKRERGEPESHLRIAEEEGRVECEGWRVRKDGSRFWADVVMTALREDDGQLYGFAKVVRDMSERRAIEDELIEKEARLAEAQAVAHIGSWIWDIETRSATWSDELYRIFGVWPLGSRVTPARVLGLIHPEDREAVDEALRKACAEGQPFHLEHRIEKQEGEVRWLESIGRVVVDEATGLPRTLHGTGHDITERKLLERQFLQSQRLEAIGRLAGGIAHDFNNLLTAIAGYAELILLRADGDPDLRPDVEEIARATQRAEELTSQLLAFARRQPREPEAVDLGSCVRDLERLLKHLLGSGVALELRLGADLPPVLADRSQLDQILLNLVANARDAMPDGGTLTLETHRVPAAEPAGGRPEVALVVRDDGVGMDARTKARIFEPFFTTKELGKGTGLGLATVFGIVAQSGGRIEVESEPSRGSTFTVHLPVAEEEAPTAGPDLDVSASETGDRHRTILVVEDEAMVGLLVQRLLERLGYRVRLASDPQQALELVRRSPASIDLLLSDVIMPGMSGPQLVGEVRAIAPGLPVLYMSGYSGNMLRKELAEDAALHLIQKPLSGAKLAAKIESILDAPLGG